MQQTRNPPHSVRIEPHERLKQLISYSNAVEVDFNVPPKRYYRSGLEMVRMANVYYKEGSLENAYVLYLKFMTLFLEKIRRHPEYATVPASQVAVNKAKLREILPRAEKLKEELLEQYKRDYARYVAQTRERERQNRERRGAATPAKEPDGGDQRNMVATVTPTNYIDVETPADIGNIDYPDPISPIESLDGLPENNGVLEKEQASHDPPISVPSIDRSKKPTITPITTTTTPSIDIFPQEYAKNGLRTVNIPSKVPTLFESMVHANTSKNVETCGILAGKLEQNELTITHMILPKQKGTSDSCITTNEEEIFDYQDHHNLITIGWIHTHPTQSSFLSSVDLHTQCPYQLLMPEAIAIVCAPKYKQTGFFVLTPSGLEIVGRCRKTGFHPHPSDSALFMVPEHIKMDKSAPLDVLDLRVDK